MTETDSIRKETQLFCWMLTLHDLSFSDFTELTTELQYATAAAYGMRPDGLAIALEQIAWFMANRNALIKRIAELQVKGAH
jgi:hypothetical protein